MSLLEDIETERATVSREINELTDQAVADAREAIASRGTCSPCAIAIVGAEVEHYSFGWTDAHRKAEVFATLNERLDSLNASAATVLFPGELAMNEDADEADTRPAIITITRTPAWKRTTIFPYEPRPDGPHWLDPVTDTDFTTPLLQVPRLD